MSSEYIFPEVDKSHWLVNDKKWLAAREKGWAKVSRVLDEYKSKKMINLVKRYYMKGETPDWIKYYEKEHPEGYHLDLFSMLWLHPSRDYEVLKKIRNQYIACPFTTVEGFAMGVTVLHSIGYIRALSRWSRANCKNLSGDEELLFRVTHDENINNTVVSKAQYTFKPDAPISWVELDINAYGLADIISISKWLLPGRFNDCSQYMLLQYDLPLEYFFKGLQDLQPDDLYLVKGLEWTKKGLYRFYHFDVEKEGDTARTKLVHKLREMFDHREYSPLVKELWEQVKSGEIVVDEPW